MVLFFLQLQPGRLGYNKTNIQHIITTRINMMCKNEFSHVCFHQGWKIWGKKRPNEVSFNRGWRMCKKNSGLAMDGPCGI